MAAEEDVSQDEILWTKDILQDTTGKKAYISRPERKQLLSIISRLSQKTNLSSQTQTNIEPEPDFCYKDTAVDGLSPQQVEFLVTLFRNAILRGQSPEVPVINYDENDSLCTVGFKENSEDHLRYNLLFGPTTSDQLGIEESTNFVLISYKKKFQLLILIFKDILKSPLLCTARFRDFRRIDKEISLLVVFLTGFWLKGYCGTGERMKRLN